MTSSERAPEPTMEEILASIRRIISEEDEANSAKPRSAAASSRDDEGLEAAEGEADDEIINDIARVLSGAQQTPAEEEEDILDLTSELGGLEIVEETVSVEVIEEAVPAEALAEPEVVAMPVEMPQPEAEAAPEPDEPEPMPEFIPEPVPEPQMQAPEPVAASAPPSPMTASEEAATALERAIAALRAGQLPTSISEFAPQPQPAPFSVAPQPEPEPEPQPTPFYVAAEPEPEPEPEPEAYAAPEPELQQEAEPEFPAEPEAELVLTEFETEAFVEDTVPEEAATEAEASPAWESETAPWTGAPEPLVEPERHFTNGYSAEQKTLEDSVKDMLRPMLRQWLDENMPRMVTAALKDELRDNPARFQRD